MMVYAGIATIFICVIGGYLMGHGNLSILFQPAELVIIGGAAIGSFLISSPPSIIQIVKKNVGKVFKGAHHDKAFFMSILALLFELFMKMRKEGMLAIEKDVESPENSEIFKKFPHVIHNEKIKTFICDNLKLMTSATIMPYEFENIMDMDIDSSKEEGMIASHAINTVSDALPGLGIVAAVLGIVITMGKINEPPEILGHHVGAALVGTFLGILMCYGFGGPIATNLGHQVEEEAGVLNMIKTTLTAFLKTTSPQISVEFGRRAIGGDSRPGYNELEVFLKKKD